MSHSNPPTKNSSLMSKTRSTLARLYADERGAEGLEKLLIIAAIVLPLLGLLIIFRDEMGSWVRENWETAKEDADSQIPGANPTP
ncbi:MAG: hypothetical protein AAF333_04530 [Planctomycetota bacterium]